MAIEKKESNRLYKKTWTGDTLKYETITGKVLTFNMGLASVKQHDNAKRYGFDVKLQRMFAVSATEFPTNRERADEGFRRATEWVNHVYSGSDEWEAPSKGFTRGPSKEDCVEALERAYPGKGELLFTKKENKLRKDQTPELLAIETVKFWLATKQVAAAWAEIQSARRAIAAANFGDADDEVESLHKGMDAMDPSADVV